MSPKTKVIILFVVVEVLFVIAVVVLSGCGGDDDESPNARTTTSGKTTGTAKKGDDKPAEKTGGATADTDDMPALRTFASGRAEGLKASATANGLVRRPKELWLRVSAAPKQKVRVSYNLTCGTGKNGGGDFIVTPPDIRQIKLPEKNPKVCPVGVAAQLDGKGRLKVALLRDR